MGSLSPADQRKLVPLYDACDNGNYRLAVQLADKLLKKTPGFQCAKALKALSLNRLYRKEEATELMADLVKEGIRDDSTFHAATITLRELGRPDLLVLVCENSVKLDPKNEEYSVTLFLAYARVGEWKKQQQLAMAMFKNFGNHKYYFWAVMSMLLQAQEPEDEAQEAAARKMLLPLAERMMDKVLDKIDREDLLFLYLKILELQGKHDEAVSFAEGAAGDRCLKEDVEKRQTIANLNAQAGRWARFNELHKGLLDTNPDEWGSYRRYLDAVFANREGADSREQAWEFINGKVAEANGLKRGPFLAQLDFISRLEDSGEQWAGPALPNVDELLAAYYKRYGSKWCCLPDMGPYLRHVKDPVAFARGLRPNDDPLAPPVEAPDAKELLRITCWLQLCHRLGVHEQVSSDDRQSIVAKLVQLYECAVRLSEGLKPRERQYSDDVIILASEMLVECYVMSEERRYLVEAALLLARALERSKYNHHIKIPLVLIYRHLGAIEPAMAVYETMEVKHIQTDTLSHLVREAVLLYGHTDLARAVNGDCSKVYKANNRETTDMLAQAYKHSTFSKIHEFIMFHRRLGSSVIMSQIDTDNVIVEVLTSPSVDTAANLLAQAARLRADEDFLATRTDNRDFHILKSHSQPVRYTVSEAHEAAAKVQQLQWLAHTRRKLHLLDSLLSAGAEDMQAACDAYQEHWAKASGAQSASVKMPVAGPPVVPFDGFSVFASALLPLTRLAIALKNQDEATVINAAAADTLKALEECEAACKLDAFNGTGLELLRVGQLVEVACAMGLVAERVLGAVPKRKKKPTAGSTDVPPAVAWSRDLSAALKRIHDTIKAASVHGDSDGVCVPAPWQGLAEGTLSTVTEAIHASRQKSMDSFATMVQLRIAGIAKVQ